ncbi:MAG: zinc ABC transporter substrate-binding protein [Anaerolineaceae bacterium]|nr:zinc ABC transporter substrate-binding protein [Anaerolineaceae bacterium]
MLRYLGAFTLASMACITPVFAQDEPSRIVATTTQASDLIRVLTADLPPGTLALTALMGSGVDPHLYLPTEADIRAIQEADAVFYSGLHLEGQFGEVFANLSNRGIATHALSEPVERAGYIIGGFTLSERYQNVADPHFWFDPRNWQMSATYATDALVQLLPDHRGPIEENAIEYAATLSTLFTWAEQAMAVVPEQQRVLVSSHDAFQYFGAAFGWQVRGLQGISTEDEAGVADIQQLVEFVMEREIPVIFVESSVPPDAIEAVQEAVRANGGRVRLGIQTLYSDAMDAPEHYGGRYPGMLISNILIILESYRCAGIDLTIPPVPEELAEGLPAELAQPDCAVID